MSGHIHAILLLACPLAAGLVLIGANRRTPTRRQVLISAFATALLLSLFPRHMCNEGNAVTQWFLPGACIFFILAFVGRGSIRAAATIALLAAMVGLTLHFDEFAHGPIWSGNPNNRTDERMYRRAAETRLQRLAERPEHADAEFVPGWLRDLSIWPALNETLADEYPQGELRKPSRTEYTSEWHSFFTRLYRVKLLPADYWYVGGRLAETEIEVRDRASILQ